MWTQRTPKLATVLTLALALLLATSPPAGAATVNPVSGTIVPHFGLFNFDLAVGAYGTPPCAHKPSTLDLTAVGTASNGTLSVTQAPPGTRQFTFFHRVNGNPTWYQVDVQVLVSDLTYTANPAAPPTYLVGSTGSHLLLQMRIYEVTSPSCAKTNLRCIATWQSTVTSGYTDNSLPTWTPGMAPLVISATTSSVVSVSACAPPWNTMGGATIDLVNVAFW